MIGVTGGSGSGKTEVCRVLEGLGVVIIDADRLGHKVYLKDSESPAFNRIVEFFGNEILDDFGEIDRSKLGKIVFGDEVKLKVLSGIVHPYIIEIILNKIAGSDERIFAIDAFGLVEAGLHKECDVLIGVFAPIDKRVERILQRDAINPEAAQSRIDRQMNDKILKQYIDYEIYNDGDMDELERKTRDIFNTICTNFADGL